jgi:hypothetical protein
MNTGLSLLPFALAKNNRERKRHLNAGDSIFRSYLAKGESKVNVLIDL